MGRQILALLCGIILSFFGAAAGGYLLYRLSDQWPHSGPVLARYVLDPVIAVLVGLCVGALAKSRPGVLAAASLIPAQIAPLLTRRLDLSHSLLMVSLAAICLLIAAAAAVVTFRGHARTTVSALETK